eukprot:XP_001705872.1 Reverse transcriptase/endonuclease, putative [Giardia lamblia ATCC 50803]
MGLLGRQQGGQRPGGAVGGRPGTAGEGAYFNRLLTRTHQLPDRAATYCLQMCGVLTEEERALKEKGGSIMAQKEAPARAATRHDMIVACLYLRVSGKLSAELEVKTHSHLSDQNQKPDIWLVDKCKAVDVGVIQPRQMDTTARRPRSTGTGRSRSSTGRTDPSTPVQGAPQGAPRGPLSGLPSPSPTWLQRRTST